MNATISESISADETLALTHVRKVKGFYVHFVQYCVVVGALAIVNYLLTPQYYWVIWVALGWGSGVLIHGLRVFDKVPFLSGRWEQRQVEKYLGRKL